MVMQPRKQITLKLSTTKQLDEYKMIPTESYDSIINRMIKEIEERNG